MNDIKDTQQFKDFIKRVESIEKRVIQECVKVLKHYNLQEHAGKVQLLHVNEWWPRQHYNININDTILNITYDCGQSRINNLIDLVVDYNNFVNEKRLLEQLIKIPYILKENIQQENKLYIKRLKHFNKINKLISSKYTINMLNNYYKELLK